MYKEYKGQVILIRLIFCNSLGNYICLEKCLNYKQNQLIVTTTNRKENLRKSHKNEEEHKKGKLLYDQKPNFSFSLTNGQLRKKNKYISTFASPLQCHHKMPRLGRYKIKATYK